MKIKKSLTLDTILTSVYFLSVFLFLIFQISQLQASYKSLANDEVPFQRALDGIHAGVLRVIASTSEYVLLSSELRYSESSDDDQQQADEEEELREEGEATIFKAMDNFTPFTDRHSHGENYVNELQQQLDRLLSQSRAIIDMKNNNVRGDPVLDAKEELEDIEHSILSVIARIQQKETEIFNGQIKQINDSLQDLVIFTLLAIAGFIVLTLARSFTLFKKVFTPLNNLERDIADIRKGDSRVEQSLQSPIGSYEIDIVRQSLRELLSENTRNLLRLSAAKTRAEEANKVKSQFLANMSHELRTPMHAIHNFTNLSLKYAENAKQIRFLQNTRVSALRLTALLNNLLDLSKLEEGRMTATFNEQDLTALVNNCIEEINSLLLDKHIEVNFDAETVYTAMFDQMLISQVLINLLSNAIKFSPEHSTISIRIEKISKTLLTEEQMFLRLSVTDQGIGIPEDQLESIFDKFVQSSKTTSKAGGTGLGLSICKEIARLHQGSIHAESPPPNQQDGSVLILEIPVVQRDRRIVENIRSSDVIKVHLELKNSVLQVLAGNMEPENIPVTQLASEGRSLLSDWLGKYHSEISNPEIIRLCHEDFHELASEVIALCDMDKIEQAKHKQDDLLAHSNKLVRLIQSQAV